MQQQPHNFSDSDKYNLVPGQRGSQNRFFVIPLLNKERIIECIHTSGLQICVFLCILPIKKKN